MPTWTTQAATKRQKRVSQASREDEACGGMDMQKEQRTVHGRSMGALGHGCFIFRFVLLPMSLYGRWEVRGRAMEGVSTPKRG